ncbi:MAG: acyltransferase [Proteobacteria bacterium]|nr:acyltransferase [Pseudomonadota bacterium]
MTTSPISKPLPKIEAIAGFKTLACILILLHHISYSYAHADYSRTFLTVYNIDFYPLLVNGWIGIYMYFGLCGYFVMRSWWNMPRRDYKEYAISRARRFLPLYYFVLLIVLLKIFPDYKMMNPPHLSSILYHVFLVSDFFLPDVMVLFATASGEFKVALLLPFILLFCLRHKNPDRSLFIMMAVLVLAGLGLRLFGYSQYDVIYVYAFNYFMFFTHCMMAFVHALDPVVCGVLVAYLEFLSQKRGKPVISPRQAKFLFWSTIVALLVWLFCGEKLLHVTLYDATLQPILVGIFTGCLLAGVVFGGAPRFFEGGFSKNVARLSYAAYLVHIPLIATSYRILMFVPHAGKSHLVNFLYVLPAYFIIVWIASELLQRFVEEPFVRNLKRYR